jgi:endonuclease YncB( thermonuclease family)
MAVTYSKIIKYLGPLKRTSFLIAILVIIALISLEFLEHYHHRIVFKSNYVRIIDGDTIQLNNIRIRLQGIDAPEMKQHCVTVVPQQICAGDLAKDKLIELIDHHIVECTDEGKDRHKRQLSYCYANGVNLNKEMVSQGYAYAYREYDLLFVFDELLAKVNKRGLWKEERFDPPWEWRKSKKHFNH